MSIRDFFNKFKPLFMNALDKLLLTLVIILVATASFGLGKLSAVGKREPLRIEYEPSIIPIQGASVINAVQSGGVIASKNGSKYHYLHCPGAKQIAEQNKITFQTAQAAEAAGYALAANCSPR